MIADECVSAAAVAAYARLIYRYGQSAFSSTLAEIAVVLGRRSRRASALLAELEQAGYLEKRPGSPPVRRLVVADQWAQIPPSLLNLDVPPLALRVYTAIRVRCRPETRRVEEVKAPGRVTWALLARWAGGCSLRSIGRALRWLRQAGLLTWPREWRGERRLPDWFVWHPVRRRLKVAGFGRNRTAGFGRAPNGGSNEVSTAAAHPSSILPNFGSWRSAAGVALTNSVDRFDPSSSQATCVPIRYILPAVARSSCFAPATDNRVNQFATRWLTAAQSISSNFACSWGLAAMDEHAR